MSSCHFTRRKEVCKQWLSQKKEKNVYLSTCRAIWSRVWQVPRKKSVTKCCDTINSLFLYDCISNIIIVMLFISKARVIFTKINRKWRLIGSESSITHSFALLEPRRSGHLNTEKLLLAQFYVDKFRRRVRSAPILTAKLSILHNSLL